MLEVDLVVLDPADREGEVDLQRAELGVDLVRGAEIDARRAARGSRSASRRTPGRAGSAPRSSSREMPSSSRSAGFSSRGLISTKLVIRSTPWARRNAAEHILARTTTRPRGEATMAYQRSRPRRTSSTRSSRTSTRGRWRSTTTSTTPRTSTNLNAALEGTEWMDRPIDAVLANLDVLPEDKRTAVRNNGGGHANHTLFWEIMGAERRRRAVGRARRRDRRHLRRARRAEGSDERRRRQALRLGLDVARLGRNRASPSSPRRTRTRRSWTARRRFSASTSGSTPTTSTTRTGAPTTSRPGGTSSTGTRSAARFEAAAVGPSQSASVASA